jgi:hypothetical protein
MKLRIQEDSLRSESPYFVTPKELLCSASH